MSVPLLAVRTVPIIMSFVAFLFVLVSIVLILVILIQKGRGGGLSSAFGGGMAGGLLGSKTGDFLTWVTIVMVAIFLLLAVLLAKFYKPRYGEGFDAEEPTATQQPAAVPAAEPTTEPAADELPTLPDAPEVTPPEVPVEEMPVTPAEAVPDANAEDG